MGMEECARRLNKRAGEARNISFDLSTLAASGERSGILKSGESRDLRYAPHARRSEELNRVRRIH
ncbi:hypothetical protein M407DRAFT_243096 [Tulasnella calospora MUT 4182]|uniref:Uncharacterized protein n=1 Tax=Tulasnella calospora MUT 4182 TaxID=1051891 RepID=A0A0C3QC52_9AGAM|nr:hypothetical protein M407DRAFT_243096 [Tulasnella calospora MUT 4182]